MTPTADAVLARAAELEFSLAVKLERTGSDRRDDPPHTEYSQIYTYGGRVRCTRAWDDCDVYPTDSVDTAIQFLRNHGALDRAVTRELDTIQRAEKAARALSSRMRRAGVDTIYARRRDDILGVAINSQGTVWAQWRSNGAMVRATSNPNIAAAFVGAVPYLERQMSRREAEITRALGGHPSRVEALTGRHRVPAVEVGAPALDATEHEVRVGEVTGYVAQLTDDLRDAVWQLYDRLDGGLVTVGTAEPGVSRAVFDATGASAGRGRRAAPRVLLRNGIPLDVPPPGRRLDEADCEWAGWVIRECRAAMTVLDRQLEGRATRLGRILSAEG